MNIKMRNPLPHWQSPHYGIRLILIVGLTIVCSSESIGQCAQISKGDKQPAYEFQMIQRMATEADVYIKSLSLPEGAIISRLKESYVGPVQFGFTGNLRTEKYSFSFRSGRLCYINRINRVPSNMTPASRMKALSMQPSTIGTNEAYHLAKQWLTAIQVDLTALEESDSVDIKQLSVEGKQIKEGPQNLPIFDVKWGPHDQPKVWVQVLGTTKELLVLRIEDYSLIKRPALECPVTEKH